MVKTAAELAKATERKNLNQLPVTNSRGPCLKTAVVIQILDHAEKKAGEDRKEGCENY